MSDNLLQVVTDPDDETKLSFLSFTVFDEDEGDYMLKACIADDADKKKHEKWRCDVVINSLCSKCLTSSIQHRAVLTNDEPSSRFYANNYGCCDEEGLTFVISGFIHDRRSIALLEPSVQLETATTRFTDQFEAKKLNANCKIHFNDSDEPVFVNRELLTVYSNVLRMMFEGDFLEKNADEVKLEVNREDFLKFLDCLYFPSVPVTATNFKIVTIIADRYDCPQLLEKCKKFVEEEAKWLTSMEECKNYIEVAERLGWDNIMMDVLEFAQSQGLKFLTEFLDFGWMMARRQTTRHSLFSEVKTALPPVASQGTVKQAAEVENTTTRFTDKTEAKELNANCKIYFEGSYKPIFANRELLAVYSKVFRSMTEDAFKDNEIKLDVKREDFLSFLDSIYSPTVPLSTKTFKAVLMMTDRYDSPTHFKKCKKFVEEEAKNASSLQECQDFIEVAEHFGWEKVLTDAVNSIKGKGGAFFMDLLDGDWIEDRKDNTQQMLFAELKKIVLSQVK